MTRLVAALGLLALVVARPVPAGAQLWQWTDSEGVVRWTNDPATIPPAFRPGARDVGSPAPRAPAAGEPRPGPDPTVLTFESGRPIKAPVHLNGTPLVLIVDTGADRTVIAPAAIARAGIDGAGGREVRILGVTGGADAREVIVPRLDVAGAQVGPLAIVVHDVGVAGVDGLLGRDVLDRFTLTLDAASGRAVLAPR
jgi:hypothetical protein